jgi:hypothetical protein
MPIIRAINFQGVCVSKQLAAGDRENQQPCQLVDNQMTNFMGVISYWVIVDYVQSAQ